MERFRIAGKFKARFVDLLNLQISKLTKPTGFTKPTEITKPTGFTKPTGLKKPTGLTKPTRFTKPTGLNKPTELNKLTGFTIFWKIAEIGKISWSAQFATS